MRINDENKSMDMEVRDINYILPAYVRSYLFYSKNEMPEKIIFPMFPSVAMVDANRQSITIPIEYVPPLDAVAVEIAEDGKSVAEVTPAQEAALDEKDEEIKKLKAEVAELTPAPEDLIRQQEENAQQAADEAADNILEIETEPDTEVSPAKAAFAEPIKVEAEEKPDGSVTTTFTAPVRQPKQPPGGDIGPGLPLSDMHPRDRTDQIRTARDLTEGPEIDEAVEKEFDKTVSRDEQGRPVVEDTDG